MVCSCDGKNLDQDRDQDSPVIIKTREDINLTPVQRQLAQQGSCFALNFLREASAYSNSNVLVSPLSAQAAFAMAAAGARGETLAEMYRALGMEGASTADVDAYMKTLLPALLDVDNSVKITMANSSWVPDGFMLKADYAATLRDNYSAEARTLAGGPEKAAADVNRWCSDHTNGLINKIVDVVPAEVRLMLVNALYFNGVWADKFNPSNSREGEFANADGTRSKAVFMNRTFWSRVWHDSQSSALSIPYGNGAFLMTLVMPSDEGSVESLMESADAEMWENWCTGNASYEVELSLPRFEAEYQFGTELIPVMRRLGMERVFEPFVADLSGVSDAPLYIGLADQKAVIKVDESGTEAAAVTVVGSVLTSVGPISLERFVFRADRPFIYFIRELSTGTVLFAGVQRCF